MSYIDDLINEKKDKDIKIPDYIEELANDLSGGWWNYRIIEKEREWTNLDGKKEIDTYYEIHEVYYKANGNIWSWSENPDTLYFETIYDVRDTLKAIKKAAKMPILKLVTDEEGDQHLEKTNKYIKNIK